MPPRSFTLVIRVHQMLFGESRLVAAGVVVHYAAPSNHLRLLRDFTPNEHMRSSGWIVGCGIYAFGTKGILEVSELPNLLKQRAGVVSDMPDGPLQSIEQSAARAGCQGRLYVPDGGEDCWVVGATISSSLAALIKRVTNSGVDAIMATAHRT